MRSEREFSLTGMTADLNPPSYYLLRKEMDPFGGQAQSPLGRDEEPIPTLLKHTTGAVDSPIH